MFPNLLLALGAGVPFLLILWFGLPAWFPGWITEEATGAIARGARFGQYPMRQIWTLLVAFTVVGLMQFRGSWGRWLSLSALLAALAVSQASLWGSGLSRYVLLGGLLPYSDAGVYAYYAHQIYQGHQVVNSLQDRPMFSCLLGSLWLFCGANRYVSLGLILLLSGTTMHLAARSVCMWFGRVSAIVFLWAVLLFYARWIGTTDTEQLGLTLGLLACPLLLAGYMRKLGKLWLAGIATLTFALCARAGAFFVLPALCVVAAIHFGGPKRYAWKLSGQTFAMVIAAMLLSRFLAFCVFDADNFPRSNFGYTAYGVVYYKNWGAAWDKYGTNRDKINAAISKRIRRSPSSVPIGMWRAWRTFFKNSYGFCFMGPRYAAVLQSFAILAFILACFRKLPASLLIAALCVGIGASIPFAPPADADTMRVYAATIPLHAIVAALGVGAITAAGAALLRGKTQTASILKVDDRELRRDLTTSATCCAAIFLLAFVIPVTRYVFLPPTTKAISMENVGSHPNNLSAGTYISLIPDDASKTRKHELRLTDFREHLQNYRFTFPKEADALAQLEAGTTIVAGDFNLLIVPTEKLTLPDSTATFTKGTVGTMHLAVDEDFHLPFETTPSPW